MKTKFIHMRNFTNGFEADACGGKTIAYHVQKDVDRSVISYGIANCHSADNYCKETGRNLALERLGQSPMILTFPAKNMKHLDVEYFLREHLC